MQKSFAFCLIIFYYSLNSNILEKLTLPVQIEDLTVYSLSELESELGVTRKTLRTYIREGKIKARKLGREQFVTKQSLVEFLEAKNSVQ